MSELQRCPICGVYRSDKGYCDKECAEAHVAELEAQVIELTKQVECAKVRSLEKDLVIKELASLCVLLGDSNKKPQYFIDSAYKLARKNNKQM